MRNRFKNILLVSACIHLASVYYILAYLRDSKLSCTFIKDGNGEQSTNNPRNNVNKPNKSSRIAHKFDNNYTAGHERLLQIQAESLFEVHAKSNLPLLRLTEQEKVRSLRIEAGKKWMQAKSVVFAGTARNAKKHMKQNWEDIHRLGKLFKNYWIVLVENDSNDGTRKYLSSLAQQHNQTYIIGCDPINSDQDCKLNVRYRSGKPHRPGWAQKRDASEKEDRGFTMSVLRNMYLDYVYHNLADKADLLIVIEPDISWKQWDLDKIAQGIYYFSNRPQLDSLCANGRLWGKIYDPCSITYFQVKHFRMPPDVGKLPEITDDVAMKQNAIPVKVESCFQAFAIYRISSLVRNRVYYSPVPGESNCEHNTLSRQLQHNFIDPQMLLDIYSLVVHSLDKW